jgi:hypothetical protein
MMHKLKIKNLGTPQVALDIFLKFGGNTDDLNTDAESEALIAIEKSLNAYGNNIFAIRVNMPSGDIVWHNGMANVLGNETINRYDQFEAFVHPDYIGTYNFWSTCLFESLQIIPDLTDFVFHICVPFKNEDSQKVSWYNQHSIALISDTAGSVLSFLSIYTFDSDWYEGNPIIMIPSVSFKNQSSDIDKMLKQAGGTKILAYEFTEMERNILACYAENIKPTARYQTMSKHTIYEHNVNILTKAKGIFQYDFHKAEDVAKFMVNNYLYT